MDFTNVHGLYYLQVDFTQLISVCNMYIIAIGEILGYQIFDWATMIQKLVAQVATKLKMLVLFPV
jgi:hypothetical protein